MSKIIIEMPNGNFNKEDIKLEFVRDFWSDLLNEFDINIDSIIKKAEQKAADYNKPKESPKTEEQRALSAQERFYNMVAQSPRLSGYEEQAYNSQMRGMQSGGGLLSGVGLRGIFG